MDTAILIDAYSQIFRAFYAIRQLNDPKGRPVNALYVFTRLLLNIEKEYPGKCGAMLFDCGQVQFRQEIAPDYKANRPPMPEDLKTQMPAIREMAEAFGWRLLSCEGYEADDLIGGFARCCPGDVRIISSDKDLSQLVNDRTQLLVPGSKSGFMIRGTEEVKEKFGVPPALIADYLALVGDSSDNIPGVPGIGPKSAAAILNELGAIESWCGSPEIIEKSKFAKKLSGTEELLKKNLILVRLRTELPECFSDWQSQLVRKAPDWQKIAAICREYAFSAILKELPAETAKEVPPQEKNMPGDDGQLDLFSILETPVSAPVPEPSGEDSAPEILQGELF